MRQSKSAPVASPQNFTGVVVANVNCAIDCANAALASEVRTPPPRRGNCGGNHKVIDWRSIKAWPHLPSFDGRWVFGERQHPTRSCETPEI